MTRESRTPRVIARRGLEAFARIRYGTRAAQRSLEIRREPAEIRRAWAEGRADVLAGTGAAEGSLELGDAAGDWGTPATVSLRFARPLPRMAAQTLAGRAVRRLKSLAETGEAPTADRNPSARQEQAT